jgi:hypothetical protein
VAVVGEDGFNALHQDFQTSDGRDPRLPANMPAPQWLDLPRSGQFADRLQEARSGSLGHLAHDHLYGIRGTRILIYTPQSPADIAPTVDVLASRDHGTGVASAAVGRRFGTAPDALLLFVPDSSSTTWEWLAAQPWIDVVSTSYVSVHGATAVSPSHLGLTDLLCSSGSGVRKLVASGRVVVSAAGNHVPPGTPLEPSGLPGVYHVGGVDKSGRTWLPGDSDAADATEQTATPTRPYDTGDLFAFDTAAANSLTETMRFNGTSASAPRTAGRIASIIADARHMLGATTVRRPALATGRAGSSVRMGPLRDGRLDAKELVQLLHHVARPAMEPGPGRFFVEGFGALDAGALDAARQIMRGRLAEPARDPEDAEFAATEQLRNAAFVGRCS